LGIVSLIKISNSGGALSGKGLAVSGIVLGGFTSVLVVPAILMALLLPAVGAAREAARMNMSMNNMKQIMLALHNHHDAKKAFPVAGANNSGEPALLSWRVHILPYIEQQDLYQQFHLDEPWDSEHNRSLISRMPQVYLNPNLPTADEGTTVYLAVTGPGTALEGAERGPSVRDFQDGTSNTIVVVEADPDHAVIWTKPDDWQYDPQNPLQGIGSLRPGGFLAGFADAHVTRISTGTDSEVLRAMMTRSGGEVIEAF
jgi:hypothetical protein